jgi:hypothetical protein
MYQLGKPEFGRVVFGPPHAMMLVNPLGIDA